MTVPVYGGPLNAGAIDHRAAFSNSITWTRSDGSIVDMTGASAQLTITSALASVTLTVGSGLTIASNVLTYTFTRAQLTSLGLGDFGYTINVDFPTGNSALLAGGSQEIA